MSIVAGYAGKRGLFPTHVIKDARPLNKTMINQPTPRPCWVSTRISFNHVLDISAGFAGYCIPFLYIYGELSLIIKIGGRVVNTTQYPAYPAAFGPDNGSFLSINGEGNANRDIPLGFEVAAYATGHQLAQGFPGKNDPAVGQPRSRRSRVTGALNVVCLYALIQRAGARECH